MFIDFLLKVFNENRENDAIIWQEMTCNYSWLSNRIREFLKSNNSSGIAKGSVVALAGTFSPNSIALFLALIEKGCIVVPLSNTADNSEANLIRIAEVEFIYRVDENDVVALEKGSNKSDNGYYQIIRERKHPGLVLFTSGTSGEPKAAVHDMLSLLEKFKTKRRALRTLNFLLFDHWGGLNTMFYILSNGGVVVATNDRSPNNVAKLIEKHEIELLPASPTFLNLVLISRVYEQYNFSSLKIISYGTEPMPESTLKRLKEVFPRVQLLQTYGLIELGVLRSKSKGNDSLWVKIGGEGYQTRVVDGALEIKAKSAMLGYLNAPSPYTEDGWFKTGDAVEMDGEYLKILGRKTEIINVGGEKVYPQEVESVIQELEGISEVIVYGEKNALMGNVVCAKVRIIADEDKKTIIDGIRRHCRKKLQRYKVPLRVRIVDEKQHGIRYKKVRKQ